MRSQRRLYRNQSEVNNSPNFIFDNKNYQSISTFEKFVIRRGSDNALMNVSYENILDGSYTTWLGGAIGYINSWKEQSGTIRILNASALTTALQFKLNTDGTITDADLTHSLIGDFNYPLTDFMISMVYARETNANNVRNVISVVGNNPEANGFMAMNNFGATGGYFAGLHVMTQDINTAHRDFQIATPSILDWNVLVMKKSGGILSEAVYNGATATVTAAYREGDLAVIKKLSAVQLNLNKVNSYKHLGIWLDMTKTPTEIMTELNAIHSIY